MKLDSDLLDIIEEAYLNGSTFRTRDFRTFCIERALMYFAWRYLNGENPNSEIWMLRNEETGNGAYGCVNDKIRKHREIGELERLYASSGKKKAPDEPPPN